MSTTELIAALDGGNTKSIAVVAESTGRILGSAVGGCGDIYGAPSAAEALSSLEGVLSKAMADAGVRSQDIGATVASLAGADWPEDALFYHDELSRRLGLREPLLVANDAIGPIWLADGTGRGGAVVLGTGAAIGVRAPGGRSWHGGFWVPCGGALALGEAALRAVSDSELGIIPKSSLVGRLLERVNASSAEHLLHMATRRERPQRKLVLEAAAQVVLEEAATDPIAARLLENHVHCLATYLAAGARQLGLEESFPVVICGGMLASSQETLLKRLQNAIKAKLIEPTVVVPRLPAVAGALIWAASLAAQPGPAVLERLREERPLLELAKIHTARPEL